MPDRALKKIRARSQNVKAQKKISEGGKKREGKKGGWTHEGGPQLNLRGTRKVGETDQKESKPLVSEPSNNQTKVPT